MGLFRKLLRRGFYAAAAVSTVLLLATLIVWPVSYARQLGAGYTTSGNNLYAVLCTSERVIVIHGPLPRSARPAPVLLPSDSPPDDEWARWTYMSWKSKGAPFETFETFLGVSLGHAWMVGDFLARFAAIPLSYLALMFSILPLLALRAIWRRRKLARIARLGLCGKCGYDLRAHASGEKCPECETVVGPKAESRK